MILAPTPGSQVAAVLAAKPGVLCVVASVLRLYRRSPPAAERLRRRGGAMRGTGPARDDAPGNFRSPTP